MAPSPPHLIQGHSSRVIILVLRLFITVRNCFKIVSILNSQQIISLRFLLFFLR